MNQQIAEVVNERVIRETVQTVSLLNSFNFKRASICLGTDEKAEIYKPVCTDSVLPGHWIGEDGGTLQDFLESGNPVVAILIAYSDDEAIPIRPEDYRRSKAN